MAAKRNGTKYVVAAAAIVTFGAAGTVLKPYVNLPWAPKITFVWASENTVARLDTQLLTYEDLLQRAIDRKDPKAIVRLQKNVIETRRKLDETLQQIKLEKK